METMNVYKRLFDAKKEIGKLTKDAKNPFFKSSYLSLGGLLDAVEAVLERHELLLLQPIEAEWVKTKIININDGESVTSEMHLPNITDPQKIGSAITYYRRYTLESLLGLKAEDDDGNSAKIPTEKPIVTVDHSNTSLPWLKVDDPNWKKGLNEKASLAALQKHFRVESKNQIEYNRLLKLNA